MELSFGISAVWGKWITFSPAFFSGPLWSGAMRPDGAPAMDQTSSVNGRMSSSAMQCNQTRCGESTSSCQHSPLWQPLQLNLVQQISHAFPWDFLRDAKCGIRMTEPSNDPKLCVSSLQNFLKAIVFFVVVPPHKQNLF